MEWRASCRSAAGQFRLIGGLGWLFNFEGGEAMDDLMDTMNYGKAALRKFGAVPEGFHLYSAEWLGGPTPAKWTRMRVTGAVFKGRRRVPKTTMTTIVTLEEIRAVVT